jgi:hypothetical protein
VSKNELDREVSTAFRASMPPSHPFHFAVRSQ